ncbi:MAG TPA: peptidylprolyl isomerase, partial [Lysobacter sp.]
MALTAHFDTDRGPIRVELAADKAPLTVANFVNLARRG